MGGGYLSESDMFFMLKDVSDPSQLRYRKKFVFSFEKCEQAVVYEQNLCMQSLIFLPEVNDHDAN